MQLFLFDPLFRLQGKIRSFRQISGTFFPFLVDFCKDQDETMKHCQRCNGPESLLADSFSKIQQNSLSRPSCRPAQCVGINRERKQRISGCWQMLFGGRIGFPVWVGWWGDDAFPANTFPRDNRLDDTPLDHWTLVILPCQLFVS